MTTHGSVPSRFEHWPTAPAWASRPHGSDRAEIPPRPDEAPEPLPIELPAPPGELPGVPVELPPPPYEAPPAPKPEARAGFTGPAR